MGNDISYPGDLAANCEYTFDLINIKKKKILNFFQKKIFQKI